MNNSKFIIITSVVAVIILFLVEQVLTFSYVYKTLIKLLIFIMLPLYYARYVSKRTISFLPSFRKFTLTDLKKVLGVGILIFTIVISTYLLLRQYLDFATITLELSKIGVTSTNFILIAIYILFVNSFIEEFFFRGYVFANLAEEKNITNAYIISSLLFAIYHIAIFRTWFSQSITLLTLTALFLGGIIFNWLNSKSRNILNSWIVHVIIDSAVIIIGFIILGFFPTITI